MPENIIAVIVAYYPERSGLLRLLDTLAKQVDRVVVVDNSADQSLSLWLVTRFRSNEHLIRFGDNRGVATAQNTGIAWAREQGADFVVLFDQDSEPAPDMIERLVEAAEAMVAQGYIVAAVGPRYLDVRQNNPPPFIRVRGLQVERCACTEPDAIVPVDYLISSGCLISMTTLDAVGAMTEELFIDYVDIEWGLRAKRFGYQSFGVCNASMWHSLGESPIQYFGSQIPLHSPLRHYYHFRNAVWLYRQSWPPLNWKLADAWRLLLKYGFYTLFAQPRLKHFRMISLGLWHGLCGRMGRFDDA